MPAKKAPLYLRSLEHATLVHRIARISVGADVESAATHRVYFARFGDFASCVPAALFHGNEDWEDVHLTDKREASWRMVGKPEVIRGSSWQAIVSIDVISHLRSLPGQREAIGRPEGAVSLKAEQAFPSAYLLVSTIGICENNCKLIRRSIRRSIWYHKAVFLGEMTFSNTATYLNRNPMSSSSTAAHLLM